MLQFLPICGGSAWRKLAVTAAVAIAAWNVQAQVPFDSKRMDHESGVAKMAIPSTTPAIKSASVIKDVQMTTNARLLNAADLQAKKPSVATDVRKAAQRAEGATDFSGNWIVSYNTLLEGGDDGGEAVTLEASTKENVYVMKNLWVNGTVVNIQIDPATGAVTIANQVIATLQDGTKLDITAINPSCSDRKK